MIKNKYKLFLVVLVALILISISTISNAAIEVKPGTSAYTTITASDSYDLCYNLRNADSTLGNNSLDPHLTLNKDWSAVAYLGASTYGNVRSKTGTSVVINERTYYSTTNNITGVMDFGYTPFTQTASIYDNISSGELVKSLINNKNSKYVETINSNSVNLKGYAFSETKSWYGSDASFPSDTSSFREIIARRNIFGYYTQYNGITNGGRDSRATFRPVIWNAQTK